jgi:hypothetical protein
MSSLARHMLLNLLEPKLAEAKRVAQHMLLNPLEPKLAEADRAAEEQ